MTQRPLTPTSIGRPRRIYVDMRREVAVKPSHGTGAHASVKLIPRVGPRHGVMTIKALIKAPSNAAVGPGHQAGGTSTAPLAVELAEPGLNEGPRRAEPPVNGSPPTDANLNPANPRNPSYPQPGRSGRTKRICWNTARRTPAQSSLPSPRPTGYGPLLRSFKPQGHAELAGH